MSWTRPYEELPAQMRVPWEPEGPAEGHEPRLVFWNGPLAEELGLEPDPAVWSGARVPAGAQPVALAYMGHQFGGLSVLGDGRAVLLGGRRAGDREVDVQLKGSGPTPFARGGDGRAGLGPMLREALYSESMHALGMPTTRTLAVATTGRPVHRPGLPPAWSGPGAVLTRVAGSHLRVGTLVQAARLGADTLRATLGVAVRRHDPDLAGAGLAGPELAAGFLVRAVERQARLVAQWMSLGFVHGVLNTDNVSLGGETIDYGPCAFVGRFSAGAVFSSIDRRGRYAYGNQPAVTAWNVTRLAETLLPLLGEGGDAQVAAAEAALDAFGPAYEGGLAARAAEKLGGVDDPLPLWGGLLAAMEADGLDFTATLRWLSDDPGTTRPEGAALAAWEARWRERFANAAALEAAQERMRRVNPATVPRTAHAEEALEAAVRGEPGPFEDLLAACRRPFTRHRSWSEPAGRAGATFCGT